MKVSWEMHYHLVSLKQKVEGGAGSGVLEDEFVLERVSVSFRKLVHVRELYLLKVHEKRIHVQGEA